MKVALHGIVKHFGAVRANENVSLTVEAGSIHGLLGENGAGKSTLVKILSGLLPRDRGEILLDGKAVAIRSPAAALRLGIGMLHQEPLDFPPLSVLDNFLVGRVGWGWLRRRAAIAELKALGERFGFPLAPHRTVRDLTLGERQQLELLRLLALGARTLILDEPTTGISVAQKAALFAALKQFAAAGHSVLFVSHQLEDVAELCDRVTVMRQGETVGTLEVPSPRDPHAYSQWTARVLDMMFGQPWELPERSRQSHATDTVLLRLENIAIAGERFDLHVPTFAARAGEIIGLAGLEGSGQQMVLRLCAGLIAPRAGNLWLQEVNLTRRTPRAFLQMGAAYVPADRLAEGLVAGLTIAEHVMLRTPGLCVNRQAAQRSARAAIEQFSIRGRPSTRVERLSGGNQQRVQLALLPPQLRLLLLEHPTRGLDIEAALWVWQELRSRCASGTTIIFASADLDELLQYSDRVMVFSGGRISPPVAVADLTGDRLARAIAGQLEALP